VLRSRDDATARARPTLAGLLVVVALSLVLLAESLVPGRALVPLVADDFEAWGAGKDPADLRGHPHPNWCMSDVLHLLAPGFAVTAGAVQRGELPLWDATQALGLPHLHQVHHGLLYPPAWIVVLLGWRGLAWTAWLHAVLAGLGMLVYLQSVGRTRTAALTGAIAFMLSAWVTARLQSVPVVGAAVWLPWVLAGLERGAQTGRLRPYLGAAAALALSFLAGFPQVTLWIATLAALVELVRAVVRRRKGHRWAAPLLRGAAALAGGAALALPQLLPTLDYLVHDSQRSTQTSEQVAQTGLETPLLWHLLVPDRYATTTLTGAHPLALLDLQQARTPAAINRAETSMGIGVLGLVLALLAILFGRGWRTRLYAGVALAGLALLCTPVLLRAGATVFPLLRLGSPKRLLLLTSFALAVLAAGGVDLLRGPRLRVSVAAWAASLAVAIAALVSLIGVPGGHDGGQIDAWAARIAAASGQADVRAAQVKAAVPPENFALAADAAHRGSGLAVIAALVALALLHPRRRQTVAGWSTLVRRRAWLLPVALSIELLLVAWPMLRAAPTERLGPVPGNIGRLKDPPLAPLLRDAAAGLDLQGAPLRLARVGDDPSWLRPNFPGMFGFTDLQCYAPMAPRRLCALLDALEPGVVLSGSAIGGFQQQATLASPLLDLLGVDALLTSHEAELPPGWKEGGRAGPVRVLVNDEALPRAFVAPRAELVAGEAERLARLTARDFDPRAVVLLEDRAAASRAPSAAPDAPPRVATITAWSPGHLTIEVPEGEPGVLVVSEGWHDGWRASIGGQRVPVWCADQTVLAVPLENRDDLSVELVFDPPLVRVAAWVGAALWAALLVGVLWPSRRIEPAAA
jgi:hypothetical protein